MKPFMDVFVSVGKHFNYRLYLSLYISTKYRGYVIIL